MYSVRYSYSHIAELSARTQYTQYQILLFIILDIEQKTKQLEVHRILCSYTCYNCIESQGVCYSHWITNYSNTKSLKYNRISMKWIKENDPEMSNCYVIFSLVIWWVWNKWSANYFVIIKRRVYTHNILVVLQENFNLICRLKLD